MRSLRISDGLNTSTRRAETTAFSPVFGLHPILCPLLRTTKEPKDESFTVSPRSRHSLISLNTDSTSLTDSARDSLLFWYTASYKLSRLTVALPNPPSQGCHHPCRAKAYGWRIIFDLKQVQESVLPSA